AVALPSSAAGGLTATYSRVQEWPGSLPAGDQLQTAACRSGYQPATSARGACEAGSVSVPTLLVVDAANVVGSVPDGWWRDRAGATVRLRDRLARLAETGVADLAPPLDVLLVVEGAARDVPATAGVRVCSAPGSGD